MTTFTEGFTIPGLLAGEDLSDSQYKIVKVASTAGEVIVGAAGTDSILGVLTNDPEDAEVASIQFGGIAKVLAETGVSAGDHVACSATGRAITTTSGNDHVLGVAVTPSSSTGDLIQVALSMGNY